MKCHFAIATAVFMTASSLLAADPAEKWEETIQKFEAVDRESAPPKDGVLFVGSSSIRMWDTEKWFPKHNIINRGFGGSQQSELNYFIDRIVLNYKPRTIVVYEGDNDIGKGKTAETVLADYHSFLKAVAKKLPDTHVIFLPIKPSISRWKLWPEMKKANKLIQQLSATQHNWHVADTVTPMLDKEGKPAADLFLKDGLHLNDKGYQIWTDVVTPLLDKVDDARKQKTANGTVFHDANKNRKLDDGEKRLAGIRVSNGRDIVTTDGQGNYSLRVDDDDILFVIKPRGWRTPLSKTKLPEFYYIHKPKGSPQQRFPGVAPTGPLPESVDFPLYPQDEPDQFRAILFGDPQPRNQKEIDYIAHDVIEELVGKKASFGVTLGDIMFDDLSLFRAGNQTIALLGIPWYNVIGNHDLNMDAKHDHHSDETFESVYGPSYYSFDHGPVHFLVLDDVKWFIPDGTKKGRYRGGLGPDQIEFIRNDLALIPDDQLVVLFMHIPLEGVDDRQSLYRLIERRPFCMSVSGHTHHHEHRYITDKDGWRGPEPHHHVINVTVSGSWWSGAPDERGIPHTIMSDGAPNGYSIINFDGQKYRLDFKAAGRPADYQMRIHVPESVAKDNLSRTSAFVNVFNGSVKSKVDMRLDDGPWQPMKQTREFDPAYVALALRDNTRTNKTYRDLPRPKISPHLWKANLPSDLAPGAHLLQVRVKDQHEREYNSGRVIRVTKE